MQTSIYILDPSAWRQFVPACAVLGIILQIFAIRGKNRPMLAAGLLLACLCAVHERDITLLIGDILACAGIWICLFYTDKNSRGN